MLDGETVYFTSPDLRCIAATTGVFAIACPSAWHSLSDPVRNPKFTNAAFRRLLDIFVRTVLAHPLH